MRLLTSRVVGALLQQDVQRMDQGIVVLVRALIPIAFVISIPASPGPPIL